MKTVKTNIIKFLFGITILCLCQTLTAQTDSVEVVVAENEQGATSDATGSPVPKAEAESGQAVEEQNVPIETEEGGF